MEKDFIKVSKITLESNHLKVDFTVSDNLNHYFKELFFWAEYSKDITNTPESIAVLPFVCNVLPIIWVTDSILIIDEIDEDFYDNLNAIKKGYKEMYPMLDFRGEITIENVIKNSIESHSDNVACLFSGGVDAFATLFDHIDEKPQMITIWGGDVKLTDDEGWKIAENHIQNTAKECHLPNPIIVKSNFVDFINQIECNHLVKCTKYNYWYGLQHGIGMISLVAPIAYHLNLNKIYIASSFTIKERGIIPCASDPSIDNNMHFAGIKIWHDQYDKNRQQKVSLITSFCNKNNLRILLRTCYMPDAKGGNCKKKKKCLRSIYGILAENNEPKVFGFNLDRNDLKKSTKSFLRKLPWQSKYVKLMWTDIQNRFKETQAFNEDSSINWIFNYNFMHEPFLLDKVDHYYNAILHRLKL